MRFAVECVACAQCVHCTCDLSLRERLVGPCVAAFCLRFGYGSEGYVVGGDGCSTWIEVKRADERMRPKEKGLDALWRAVTGADGQARIGLDKSCFNLFTIGFAPILIHIRRALCTDMS